MKRSKLLKHLNKNGAFLLKEGRKHSIFYKGTLKTQVPRHIEIVMNLPEKFVKT